MSRPLHLSGLSGKAKEVLTPITCKVEGQVPRWLSGCLYRNGPGIFDVKTKNGKMATVPHWFDGLTLLHAFEFEDGRVTYRNRYLYPQLEEYMQNHGRLPGTFAGDPCQTLFGAAMSKYTSGMRWLVGDRPPPEFNIGVTIGHIQGHRLVSKTDFNGVVEVDPHTLQPQPMTSYTDINPEFKGFFSAAHGQYDPSTRQYFNYTLDFPQGQPTYTLFAIPDDEPRGHVLCTLRADAAYIHSFAMTENYLVFIVWPALLSVLRLALGGSPGPALSWHPERDAMLYVVDKKLGGRGHVATYSAPPFFCFHTINSFEEGGALHVDLCGYNDLSLLKDLYMKNLRSGEPGRAEGTIRRYTLGGVDAAAAGGPEAVQQAEVATLCDMRGEGAEAFDLPRIHPARHMQRYKHVYCTIKSSHESYFLDGLAKVDVSSGIMLTWQQEGEFPGEPIFLPSPEASSEDEGLLLSVVLQGCAATSSLVLLDAQTMEEVGRALVPQAIPFGFHGNFFPAASMRGTLLGTQLD